MRYLLVLLGVVGILMVATPCQAVFLVADFEGEWDYIYDLDANPGIVLLAYITFDGAGNVVAGHSSTENVSITGGTVIITDAVAGDFTATIDFAGGITATGLGTLNALKTQGSGTWTNTGANSGDFLMVKRPASADYAISDLAGTWVATSFVTGDPTAFTTTLIVDEFGIITSVTTDTAGFVLKGGGATFYNWVDGKVYASMWYATAGGEFLDEFDVTMAADKKTMSGSWASTSGQSGTLTIARPSSGGGGGGGGGCFLSTLR